MPVVMLAVPINWQEDREPPLIINPARTSRTPPGIGDRVLARLARAESDTYRAEIIRRLEGGPKQFLVLAKRAHSSRRQRHTL